MRKQWKKLLKKVNLFKLSFLGISPLILSYLFWLPDINLPKLLSGYLIFLLGLVLAQKYKPFKDLLEDNRKLLITTVGLLLLTLAETARKLNWFHIDHLSSAYYLLFLGSIIGVLAKAFLRNSGIKWVIGSVALGVLIASKNIFVFVGFLLANLISADIYNRYRNTLSEIFAVALGNAIFTVLLIANQLLIDPSLVWEYLIVYPISVITEVFILFGLRNLLDLIPFMYSDEKLRNVANLSNPLLEEMLIKAPGTYHHSVMVSLLSEAVAKKVGADPLLVKIGAMFHDIGKLVNPSYFIENTNGANPHDKLSPEVSASIIKSHVSEGLALAKKYNLPREIEPFIPEHQGTKLIKYFYIKAKEKNPNVDISKFRYDGPIPQSKETAIVMIVDTVEAMVRSLKNPTPEEVKKLISSAVERLKEEHQLDDSGLTEEDLEKIKKSLSELILSYYHERIKYPEEKEKVSK